MSQHIKLGASRALLKQDLKVLAALSNNVKAAAKVQLAAHV
jgi:hypothetical protein